MNEIELKNKEQLEINRIKETPFQYVTDGEKNLIICGKVVLETTKTKEETEKALQKIPWEEVALLCQAILNEMLNEKK